MAKPNYAFAKRQRDLAKKQKKEEKKLRKAHYQEQMAQAILAGIKRYFAANPRRSINAFSLTSVSAAHLR